MLTARHTPQTALSFRSNWHDSNTKDKRAYLLPRVQGMAIPGSSMGSENETIKTVWTARRAEPAGFLDERRTWFPSPNITSTGR